MSGKVLGSTLTCTEAKSLIFTGGIEVCFFSMINANFSYIAVFTDNQILIGILQHLQAIQQNLIPEMEGRLRKKCEVLVNFYDSSNTLQGWFQQKCRI